MTRSCEAVDLRRNPGLRLAGGARLQANQDERAECQYGDPRLPRCPRYHILNDLDSDLQAFRG
jgi:hypothetical protein